MAVSTAAARRYAEALFVAARNANQVDAIESDLGSLTELVNGAPQFGEALRNPLIPAERKRQIVDRLLSTSLQPISLRLLYLLVEKRRSEVLPLLHPLYVEMANEYRGIVPAHVTSAVPLTTDEERRLAERLASMTGKQIVLQKEVRPELIGGMRVRIGDTVIDGSVVGYLRQLRAKLKETLV